MKAKSKKPATKPAAKTADKKAKGPTIFKNVKSWEGGVREATQKAIPPSGATAAAVQAKLKVPERKVLGYLNWLAANGYVKRIKPAA